MPELEPLLPVSLPVTPEEKAAPIIGALKIYTYVCVYIYIYVCVYIVYMYICTTLSCYDFWLMTFSFEYLLNFRKYSGCSMHWHARMIMNACVHR